MPVLSAAGLNLVVAPGVSANLRVAPEVSATLNVLVPAVDQAPWAVIPALPVPSVLDRDARG